MVKAVSSQQFFSAEAGTSSKAEDQPFRARGAHHSVTPEVERLLIEGYARGAAGKTKAIQAALKLQPELTRSALWKHARKLAIASHRAKTPAWQPWQVRMVGELMGEVSRAEIAELVERSVTSVASKATALHWSLRLRNGYSVRQAASDLMVSPGRIRDLIGEGSLRVEKKRITEESYRSFCRLRPRRVNVEALTIDEWRRLIAAASGASTASVRELALVRLLGDGGLTAKEVSTLHFDDLAWYAVDCAAIRLAQGKSREARTVILSGSAGIALRDYRSLRSDQSSGALLFIGDQGAGLSIQAIDSMVSRLARRAQIVRTRVTSRTLRHTFAVNYLKRNAGKTEEENAAVLLKLSRVLGHSSIYTVQLYIENLRIKPKGSGRGQKKASEKRPEES